METANPYNPPQGELLDDAGEFGEIKVLSAKGRLGRLRYIAYCMGVALLSYLVMAVLSAASAAVLPEALMGPAIVVIFALGYGAMLVISVMLTIQRCHDFDMTGWLSLILLIPLLPLVFWFIPGTQGANRFGAPPPPNRGGMAVVAILLVAVMVIGILAAIAIPTYQGYMAAAQGIQG